MPAHTALPSGSFSHRDSDEVVMCLSVQSVPFLRKNSDLVNTQLTIHWGAKKREIFGLHKHLLLSVDLIEHLHSSGVLH